MDPAILQQHEHMKQQCMDTLLRYALVLVSHHPSQKVDSYTLSSLPLFQSLGIVFSPTDGPLVELCLKLLTRRHSQHFYPLLDLTIYLSDSHVVEESLPLLLLEDKMDCSPFIDCQTVFSFIEQRQDELLQGMVPNRGKGLIILRLCNELLRRASKSVDARFCGRILFFLSRVFPLTERSAVNLKGNFNVDNITIIEPPKEGETVLSFDAMKSIDAVKLEYDLKGIMKDLENDNILIPYPFYQSFWKLQSFCSQPSLMISSPVQWSLFSSLVVDIVFLLEACIPHNNLSFCPSEEHSYPKMLSSRQLLKYQLRDPSFLFKLLVQILILFGHIHHHLLSTSKTMAVEDKFKTTQLDFVQHGKDKCLSLMDTLIRISPVRVSSLLKVLLMEEDQWVLWKKNGCQPFEKPDAHMVPEYIPSHSEEPMLMLDSSLVANVQAQLHQAVDRSTKDPAQHRVEPQLSEYLSPLVQQLDPSEQIEKEYRLDNDPVYVWRAFRLVSRQSIDLLKRISTQAEPGDELVQLVHALHDKPSDSQ